MKETLTKLQMSSIKGGKPTMWVCVAMLNTPVIGGDTVGDNPSEEIMAETALEAADIMHDRHKTAKQVNCTKA